MADINLLPQELKPSGTILKISARLKAFALLGVIFFMISAALYFSALFFLNYRITSSQEEQESLKTQIKALEKTEQRLVLVKDRLTKISTVSKKPKVNDELERLMAVSDLFPTNTNLVEVELTENNAGVVISSDNLDGVANYLASVVASGKFVKVNLKQLKFDSDSGYSISLAFPE